MINTQPKLKLPRFFNDKLAEGQFFDVPFAEKYVQDPINNETLNDYAKNLSQVMTVGFDFGKVYIAAVSIIMPDNKIETILLSRSEADEVFTKFMNEFKTKQRSENQGIADLESRHIGLNEYTTEWYGAYATNFVADSNAISTALYDIEYDKKVREARRLQKSFFDTKANEVISKCKALKDTYDKEHNTDIQIYFAIGHSNTTSATGQDFSGTFQKALIPKAIQNGFKLFFVKEPYTSQACAACYHRTVQLTTIKFRVKQCLNCLITWHRDVLAALNIASNLRHILFRNGVPEVFKHEEHYVKTDSELMV